MNEAYVTVIGGGLAGCEAAWQAAQRGIDVTLYEMRPNHATPAHCTDLLAELVCSNSLGSNLPDRAPGLLKAELRRLGSLILSAADETAVPAGTALAVGRKAFSQRITEKIEAHPRITVCRQEVFALPIEGVTIIATGPLTSDALAADIAQLAGQEQLYFYDAMAPIVALNSIDMGKAFRGSRYGHGEDDEGDYINCPLNQAEYDRFVEALLQAECTPLRNFEREDERFFEACLPVEVIAERGREALAFGPLKPVGLTNPYTGRRPYAVVQLRQDNLAATLYNLVGFQTNLRWSEQQRVFRLIPGLEEAEFVRYGQMHRNTYINSPALLEPTLAYKAFPEGTKRHLFFAGQLTGTEGYVGSTASGLIAGINAARLLLSQTQVAPPPTTMIGALLRYITTPQKDFQPMKANMGLLPPLEPWVHGKRERFRRLAKRAIGDLESFTRDKLI
ncbi:MAG: methylenetetrahydrofolate--tRNA-(uracil(54)-C(5))-methyltransferase (FADH(2)-oxidizing) TrmFO [Anaerolineae bacterium]|nr:methylenetetrahydrofolate--tRNA-(uracil(54)-C(5))-methyltransferase (FADH(2)-oxidizing) TrmFO [Anaerolineae bacterium]